MHYLLAILVALFSLLCLGAVEDESLYVDEFEAAKAAFSKGDKATGAAQIEALFKRNLEPEQSDAIVDGAWLLGNNGYKDRAIELLRDRMSNAKENHFDKGAILRARNVLQRMSGTYERPPMSVSFTKYQSELNNYCRLQALTGRKIGKRVDSFLLNQVKSAATNQNANSESPFDYSLLFKNVIGEVSIPEDVLGKVGCWSIENQPELKKKLIFSCPALTQDMIEILWPVCSFAREDKNECTALNVHLAETAADLGPKFDKAFAEYYDLIDKLSKSAKVDLYAEAKKIADKYGNTPAEKGRLATVLLGAVANDDQIPYFFYEFEYAIKNDPERMKNMSRFLRFQNERILEKVKALLKKNGVNGQPPASGMHHYVSGMILGCELANKGWDEASAQWAGFMSGAVYEAKDLVSHFEESKSKGEDGTRESRFIQNFKNDTGLHKVGAASGSVVCR